MFTHAYQIIDNYIAVSPLATDLVVCTCMFILGNKLGILRVLKYMLYLCAMYSQPNLKRLPFWNVSTNLMLSLLLLWHFGWGRQALELLLLSLPFFTLGPCWWSLLSALPSAPWNRNQAEHKPVCSHSLSIFFLCKLRKTIFTLQSPIKSSLLVSSALIQQAVQWIALLSAVLYLGLFSELQAHFEPASEAEGVDKDTEVEGNYPFVDLLGQEVHMIPRGTRPGSVAIEEGQPQQQDPSLQLSKLRQETNRSGSHTPGTRSSGHSWKL